MNAPPAGGAVGGVLNSILQRASALKGVFHDATEMFRTGGSVGGDGVVPRLTDEFASGFADAEPPDDQRDGWLDGISDASLNDDFLRACRRAARHLIHVDAWAQWAPEVREEAMRIFHEQTAQLATRVVVKHAAACGVDPSTLHQRAHRHQRRPRAANGEVTRGRSRA
jgi:hypothetical protein